MSYKAVIKRIRQLIINPAAEWQIIKNEAVHPVKLIGEYWIYLLLFFLIGALLGNVLFSNDIERSLANKLFYVIGKLLFLISGFVFCFSGLISIARKNKITVTKKQLFTVFFYSYSIVWAVAAITSLLANYRSLTQFIHVLSAYGCFVFWMGVEAIINPPAEKRIRFLGWSLSLFLAVYILMYFLSIHLMRFFMLVSGLAQL